TQREPRQQGGLADETQCLPRIPPASSRRAAGDGDIRVLLAEIAGDGVAAPGRRQQRDDRLGPGRWGRARFSHGFTFSGKASPRQMLCVAARVALSARTPAAVTVKWRFARAGGDESLVFEAVERGVNGARGDVAIEPRDHFLVDGAAVAVTAQAHD